MDALRDWYSELAPRERLLVAVAALLTVVAIVVLGMFRPLNARVDRGMEIVAEKESLLTELEQVAARLGPQRGSAAVTPAGSGQSLVLVVDQTTRRNGLAEYLTRNQPDGEDKIRLRFERAPFDELMQWLVELRSTQGLTAESANIDTAPEAGRVNCNLVLIRAGS